MEPTDWFRVRHREPFPAEAVASFRASCAVYRARMEAILEHWSSLPTIASGPKPVVAFFEPEVSGDGRVMSLPVRIEGRTLGCRSLFQSTAGQELHAYLPLSVVLEIEVGVTEPAFDGPGLRHDWWNPHRDSSMAPEEALRQLGFRLEQTSHAGVRHVVPGWGRRIHWWVARLGTRLRGRRTRR